MSLAPFLPKTDKGWAWCQRGRHARVLCGQELKFLGSSKAGDLSSPFIAAITCHLVLHPHVAGRTPASYTLSLRSAAQKLAGAFRSSLHASIGSSLSVIASVATVVITLMISHVK